MSCPPGGLSERCGEGAKLGEVFTGGLPPDYPGASALLPVLSLNLVNQGVHFRHDFIIGNARARIGKAGLYALTKPTVVAVGLLLGFKLAHNGI